jgi:hypothetical protein
MYRYAKDLALSRYRDGVGSAKRFVESSCFLDKHGSESRSGEEDIKQTAGYACNMCYF